MEQTEIDKKKEYLRSYRKALLAEKAIEEEIQQLRLDKMCPSVIQDGMPHASGGGDLSGYVAKIDELLENLRQSMEQRIQLRQEITARIEAMEDETEKLVLRLRYIHCKTFEVIATEIDYCYKQVCRIHGKALAHFTMS